MINIVFFGEAMIELNPENILRFGGDTYNSAVYFKRLCGEGADVFFVTAIGTDPISDAAYTSWLKQGLNLNYVQHSATYQMGKYGITIDAQGERLFQYERDDSAARRYFSLDTNNKFSSALSQGDFSHVYFSAISLAILSDEQRRNFLVYCREHKKQGGNVFFDSNYRSALWSDNEALPWFEEAYSLADIIFVTDDDHYAVFGSCSIDQLIDFYSQYNSAEIIIKQGVNDTLVLEASLNSPSIPSKYPVIAVSQVVDTTAAGDSFSAGYLAKRLFGGSIAEAVLNGQHLAAQVIRAEGAIVDTKNPDTFSSAGV
jgi:2-dehydro-3-deoxygluconokinase